MTETAKRVAMQRSHAASQRIGRILILSTVLAVSAGVYFDSLAIGFGAWAAAMLWRAQ